MENWDQTLSKYTEAVKKFAVDYKDSADHPADQQVSDHIIDVMVSVCMTRDGIRNGGSFVQAVVNNNLLEAISRADKEVLRKLRIITLAKHYCHINP